MSLLDTKTGVADVDRAHYPKSLPPRTTKHVDVQGHRNNTWTKGARGTKQNPRSQGTTRHFIGEVWDRVGSYSHPGGGRYEGVPFNGFVWVMVAMLALWSSISLGGI